YKNSNFIELCGSKGIKREYSNARTPQQNGVAERKNRTLIEAARIMLADSFSPNTFWAEVVSTACPQEINDSAGTQENSDAGTSELEAKPVEEHLVLPFLTSYSLTYKSLDTKDKDLKLTEKPTD
ncbi:putative ribonuclease H-like domain-containing protein, partial [Tanacetum coccineum]